MQGALNTESALHIVCFDNPYPPDYGGVIDVYYKIKALHERGVKMTLHVFIYGKRQARPELETVCHQVIYYRRNKSLLAFFSAKPYIAKTRTSKELINNLLKDNNPILLEGLHCTSHLKQLNAHHRLVAVRCHNIEHHYYQHLAQATYNPLKWIYFKTEAIKLRHYESILKQASLLFTISPADHDYFNHKYGNCQLIPAFHPFNETINPAKRLGKYLLFHGNLSVLENEKSVLYLIKTILSKITYPTIIAGQNPSNRIRKAIALHTHIQLVENPSTQHMSALIEDAQIILLHSHQETGIKLKLIYSLFEGRHIICNSKIVNNTGLERLCHIANNDNQWIDSINSLWSIELSDDEITDRIQTMTTNYNLNKGINTIVRTLIHSSK